MQRTVFKTVYMRLMEYTFFSPLKLFTDHSSNNVTSNNQGGTVFNATAKMQ